MPSPIERPDVAEAILAASGDGAALFSADLRVTWANARSYELLRARPGSLIGRHLFSFMAPEEITNPRGDWWAIYNRAVQSVPMQARNDLVLTRDDTTQGSFVVGGTWMEDGTFLILFNEFEGRAEIERVAAALATRYQDLFQSIPVAVWEIDMGGLVPWLETLPCAPGETAAYLDAHPGELIANLDRLNIRAVNRAGLRQHGATSEDDRDVKAAMIGGAMLGRLGGFSAQFQAVRCRTQSIVTEGVGGTGNGSEFAAEIHQFIPDGDDGLDLSRVIVTLIDISAAKQSAAELGAAVEARDRLITSVAHELRTPLTVVIGLLHMLSDTPNSLTVDEAKDLLTSATAEADDLNHLVDDLLTYSRLDTNDWHISPTVVDLWELVKDVDVRNAAGVKPEVTIEGRAMSTADPRRVRQIVRNLITNSVRYGGPAIRVKISANEVAHLEVWDDGGEIEAEAERMFEAFQRAHSSPTQPSSLGLGLTISRGLAQAMGGNLTYRRDDGWTVFQLTLPPA